jgi:hypothetical protein
VFTDADRRALYEAALASWGDRPADVLMGHLPPVGWGDVATKRDVEMLRLELTSKIDAQLPKLIAANIASMIGVAGLVLAAVSLT